MLCGEGATRNECDPAQRDGRGGRGLVVVVLRAAPDWNLVPAERGHTGRGWTRGVGLAARCVCVRSARSAWANPAQHMPGVADGPGRKT